jgi:hypothetical protein
LSVSSFGKTGFFALSSPSFGFIFCLTGCCFCLSLCVCNCSKAEAFSFPRLLCSLAGCALGSLLLDVLFCFQLCKPTSSEFSCSSAFFDDGQLGIELLLRVAKTRLTTVVPESFWTHPMTHVQLGFIPSCNVPKTNGKATAEHSQHSN